MIGLHRGDLYEGIANTHPPALLRPDRSPSTCGNVRPGQGEAEVAAIAAFVADWIAPTIPGDAVSHSAQVRIGFWGFNSDEPSGTGWF
jgi:hypothetical protein